MRLPRPFVAAALFLTACPDQGLQVVNTAPVVSFVSPTSGTTFDIGAEVVFEAEVRDPQSLLADLELQWSTDRAAVLVGLEERFTDRVRLTVQGGTFPSGAHTVHLLALDPFGASGEDATEIEVAPNAAPTAAFSEPGEDSEWRDDRVIPLRLITADEDEERLADLSLLWTGPEGVTWPEHPDNTGVVALELTLPVGDHLVSVEVFDSFGARSSTAVAFSVFDHNEDWDEDGYRDVLVGGDDCNDRDASIHPGATESCDGVDEDCDTLIDEDVPGAPAWYPDDDLDGHGRPTTPVIACAPFDERWSQLNDDCDDTNPDVSPTAIEIPYNGVDDDCANGDLCDVDRDGYRADLGSCNGSDCDDDRADVNPGAAEIPYNGVDEDCVAGDECDVDGDGYLSLAGPCGGDDCDDRDAGKWSRGPITVPTDVGSVQAAIDALCDDGRVDVLPGTYVETITFRGRNIEVVGADRDTVILDGGGAGPVVTQTRGLLKGLTVRGGVAANGAGISLVEALDARVEDVLVTGNVATMRGGGAYVLDADGRIALVDVELRGNRTTSTHTTSGGGGLFVMDSAVLLDGVRLLDNDTKGLGGGLRLLAPAHRAEITDLVAEGNTADEQAGVSIENADVDGLVLRDNTSTSSWPAGAITKSNVVGVEARGNYTPVTFDGALLLVESDADEVRVVDNAGGRRALEVRGPAARLTRAAILDNDVTEGLFVLDGAELWSLLVAGNRDIGLAVSYGSGAQTVRHATIVGNGGVGLRYGTAGGAVVSSAIVARNGTGVFRQNTSVYPRYTAVYGNSTNWGFPPPTGANNLTVDCALVRTTGPSAESWDLHLSADSPCRGAAEPGLGGTPDLGAYGGPYGAW